MSAREPPSTSAARRELAGLVVPLAAFVILRQLSKLLVAGLRLLQLDSGTSQHVQGLGEQLGAVQVEEGVETGQGFVSIQLFQAVGYLAFDVRDAALRLQVITALALALLGSTPVLVQLLQLGRYLRKPRGLGLQTT